VPRPSAAGSERAWLIAAVGIYLALAAWVVSSRHYWPRYDSGAYVSAATAVSRGAGLRDITSPVTRPLESWVNVPPWVRLSPERMSRPDWPFFGQYTPLLPLALSPLVTLGGGRFVVLQLLPVLTGLGTLVLAYRWRDVLFPGPWRLTLLACSGSMLALYGTRVQSEAVHPLFVLAGLRLLARGGEDAARLPRSAGLAALVLLLGIGVHVKLVFFAAGAAVWLLIGPRAPLGRRLWVATAFAGLTILPAMAFTFAAIWAGRPGLPVAGSSYTLGANPYFQTEGWDPSAPSLSRANAAPVIVRRAQATGLFLWNALSNGPAVVKPDPWTLFVLVIAALLAGAWWRHQRGLLAMPTAAYVAAVGLSPWTESRMAVPVVPLVAHALAVALARVPSRLGVGGERAVRQALVAGGAVILAVQASNWQRFMPQWDEYAIEHYQLGATLAMARVAAELPADRAVIAPVDNAAFALVTGHATQSLSPAEWKISHPLVFLASGGAPVVLSPLARAEFLDRLAAVGGEMAALAGPRTRQIVTFGEYGLVAEWVRVPPPAPGTTRPDPLVPGRIHPRWMRLTPADREPLARSAIPEPRT
jgi:hypothetical protein